jgi:hypothetical protein
MKMERPITLSGEMVRAILDRGKTQIRKVIKPQPPNDLDNIFFWWHADYPKELCAYDGIYYWCSHGLRFHQKAKYGIPGDKLWLKENFQVVQPWGSVDGEWIGDDILEVEGHLGKERPELIDYWWSILYQADDPDIGIWWRPSICMPRWASRITLEITRVRVERLQDISHEDTIAEGVLDDGHLNNYGTGSIRVDYFAEIWDRLNKRQRFVWEVNPWVWVIEFSKI